MTRRRHHLGVPVPVFAVTVAGAFVVALDLSIVNVAFPSIVRSFPGTRPATLSWVLSAYSVVFGALLLASGRLADRTGRRATFFRGLAIFTAASVLCGIAPAAWVLIASRALQAVGAAMLLPASLALLLAEAEPEARPALVATWGGVSALAVATGPSVGALLVQDGGWRLAFLVNIPVALVAWLLGRKHLTESAAGGPWPDMVGVGLVTAGVAALALGVTQGGGWGWTSLPVLASFATAIVLVPAALWRSSRHRAPAVDLTLFRSRSVGLANAATFAYAVGFFAMLLANVLFLTSVWGYSTLRAGLAITPGPLVVAFLSPKVGRLAARIGFRPVLVMGSAAFATGVALYGFTVGTDPHYLTGWLPQSLLVGVGVAMTFPVLSAAAVAGLPADRFAIGSATNQTARQLGAVLGVAILIAVIGRPSSPAQALHRFDLAWAMCAGAAAVSGIISAFQPRRRAADAPRPVPAAVPVTPLAPMPGLAVLEAIRDGRLEPPGAATLLGLELVTVEHGHTTFALDAGPQHLNPDGSVHGGVLTAMADFAGATAVSSVLASAAGVVTTNLNMTFIRGARPGTRLIGDGRLVHAGATLAHAEATIGDESGEVYARAIVTCRVRNAAVPALVAS